LPLAAAIAASLPPRSTCLGDQLGRASLSVPLNMAEASGKSAAADQRRFHAMACGSAMECAAILDACSGLAPIEQPRADELDQILLAIVRMLSRMCRI
jgi:four helix bundle protein